MEVPSYDLPDASIAQTPLAQRDAARLLVALEPGSVEHRHIEHRHIEHRHIEHRHVRDLPELVGPGDVLVVNTSRVLPARLHLTKRSGGAAEMLLLEPDPAAGPDRWLALVRPGRRLPPGTELLAGEQVVAVVGERADGGQRRVRLVLGPDEPEADPGAVSRLLAGVGEVPLPPYIHEALADPERYQTVYADQPGSVAAPTAGLHLTPEVLDACRAKGVAVEEVDLAVGLGTFRPVTADRAEDHEMHEERYRVPAVTLEACRTARRVVAVGTTTVRALETAAATGELEGRSHLFIHGDYPWRCVDVLLTNFHQPRSTLLLLLEAFYGPGWRDLYATAIAERYRFLSFGDAMIVAGGEAAAVTVATFTAEAVDGRARAGTVTTGHGRFTTPCFMPVGTRGAVRLIDAADLDVLGPQVVLANTYHLMLRPGAGVVAALGGLHRFTGWDGHLLTDSGGFQVFSLAPKVDDEGATFRSTYDGSEHRLTPESAVAIQEALGADIQMALDVCPGLPAPEETVRLAMDRTLQWAERARQVHRRPGQSLFGIVQGGITPDWRAESAEKLVALDFDGYGIGGLSVGEPRDQMLPALAAATSRLPPDRPRYLMGVGDPISIVESIALGVDMFDCVLPTRLARHGTALTATGSFHVRAARYATDDGPVDESCPCAVCARWSRGYLRHLFAVKEPTAGRLLTIHNLAWLLDLVARARTAVLAGTLDELRAAVAATWEPGAKR